MHKMLIRRIANSEDPGQTASKEAVWSGSAQSVYRPTGKQLVFEILDHLP